MIIGVVFMGVLANGMMMMNINESWQRVVKGIVLLIAVAVAIQAKSKRACVASYHSATFFVAGRIFSRIALSLSA